ncbi:hypothetical protein EDB92DRAFT_1844305 [Lactarius akahatsu]|uniref:Uncharacterized protein n=1 Tax=Lactarius akahatsu TaxID=416441 RepID=A0AAD4QFP3_9AGAM|nr:hypothetical protein EDB92DRAFT_1844305 [Lactarius akahatsu]
MLSNHSERRHRLDLPLTVCSKMEIAKWKDSGQRDWSHVKFEDEWGPTMTINLVLLQSPLLVTPHDPETVIVSQELSASPSLQEILWILSRYEGRARITLEQNPSICVALQMRAHIRPSFGAIHFKTPAEHSNTMTLSMFSSISRAVCFLILNTSPGSLAMFGR